MTRARWGILGGTFDPPHYGHLLIAEQVREALDLAGILFSPAAQPPHKQDRRISAAEHRLAMVQLAIESNPAFSILRAEIERGGTSYSVETLEWLSEEQPDDDFTFIVSAEAARHLPTWRDPHRLLELCRIAVVPRLGYPPLEPDWAARAFPGLEDRFEVVDSVPVGYSASGVRARAATGKSIRYLVPQPVEDYIARHGLYR